MDSISNQEVQSSELLKNLEEVQEEEATTRCKQYATAKDISMNVAIAVV